LSFAEYFDLHMGVGYQASVPPGMRSEVGPLTVQFIRMFAYDPVRTALALHEGMDLRREWRVHFPRIQFLRTERLNEQLRAFLLGQGYTRESLRFINQKERVNRTDRSQARYFTPEMMQEVRHRERFFYQLFPDYLRAFDSPTTA
ncbi:MAG TPA: hypothetical protein PKY96_07585, partial [Flavobacteriales bacterium]|nr:hypothetical protein [Flavobacteriales bacterium]